MEWPPQWPSFADSRTGEIRNWRNPEWKLFFIPCEAFQVMLILIDHHHPMNFGMLVVDSHPKDDKKTFPLYLI